MASIGSLSSSTSSSIFNTNKRITGLASGLDTDALIESMTASTRSKIAKQNQQKQLLQWKMDDYRSISSKLIAFQNKYTSYSSESNLRSPSFFDATLLSVIGENSKYVSVSGTSSTVENIAISAVKQLAQNTSYVSKDSVSDQILNSDKVTGNEEYTSSKLEGQSISFTYGSKSFTVTLSKGDGNVNKYDSVEDIVNDLNERLKETDYGTDGKKLSDIVKFGYNKDSGEVTFDFASPDVANAGNSIKITDSSEDLLKVLGFEEEAIASKDSPIKGTAIADSELTGEDYQVTKKLKDMLTGEGKTISFTYNGTTKSIELPSADATVIGKDGTEQKIFDDNGNANMDNLATYLENQLGKAFGSGRIDVSYNLNGSGALEFRTIKAGSGKTTVNGIEDGSGTEDTSSVLEITSGNADALKALKLTAGDSNRVNLDASVADSGLNMKNSGYTLQNDENRNDYVINIRNDVTGEITTIDKTVDGTKFSADTSLNDIIKAINASDANVKVSYSETSDTFTLTSTDPGASGKFSIVGGAVDKDGNDIEDTDGSKFNLGQAIFGKNVGTMDGNDDYTVTKGQDAIIYVDYDGEGGSEPVEITRSSNTFDIDGLTVTVKGTFGMNEDNSGVDPTSEAVTFGAEVDADKIVEAVKQMITDFNEIISISNTELSEKRNRDYAPLTDEQKEEMTEDQIKAWEEKAKAGMLFNDSDLKSFTSSIRFIFSSDSETIKLFEDMGITTSSSYSDHGKLSFDETKFRAALASDPETISDLFTRTEETTVGSDGTSVVTQKAGIMNQIKDVFDKYAGTSGAVKGIFVQIAGATESPLSMLDNSLLDQMDDIDDVIDRLQDKLETETERYYKQFTSLETFISQMNSQSSWLSSQFS